MCSKCGAEILDEDTLCVSCYRKKKLTAIVTFILIWTLTALITALLLKTPFTFAFWLFWFMIKKIKKSNFITERKLYQGVPVTLEELAMHEIHNEETVNKYNKTPNAQRNAAGINFEDFKQYIDIIKFRDIAKRPKSNLISDYPGYYEFVHGVPRPQTPAPTPASPIPPDVKFPKYTEEQTKDDEQDKLLNRISDLYRENEELKKRKPKKAFVAVIVVLSVILASVSGFTVYQQTQIQKISDKLEWKTKNYESSIASLNEKNDELRNNWYDACDELMLYHNNVAITVGQGIYYHKASCDIVQSALNTGINCKINNKVALKSQGYKPCPDCYPLDK